MIMAIIAAITVDWLTMCQVLHKTPCVCVCVCVYTERERECTHIHIHTNIHIYICIHIFLTTHKVNITIPIHT